MRQSPDIIILRLPKPLLVRGVGASKFSTSEYIVQNIYFIRHIGGKFVEFCVKRELYIVKKLNIKVLISLDIIGFESFILDILGRIMTVT